MKSKAARVFGEEIARLVHAGQIDPAYDLLAPVLAERTPFAVLRRIAEPFGRAHAEPFGAGPLDRVHAFLERVAGDKTEGGWVIIARALEGQLDRDLPGALARCRGFIVAGDVWYAADILGVGVAGRALVAHFEPALDRLAPWREDDNRWVRRAVGTAAHFWAKRARGAAEHLPRVEVLLAFLEPTFGEWEMDAVKGVGWGLKTLGRYYPDRMADWLAGQVVPARRRHRALTLRKALTYLSDEQRARATGSSEELAP
jgi:3-methyladenine DNA glycosylase AlkD